MSGMASSTTIPLKDFIDNRPFGPLHVLHKALSIDFKSMFRATMGVAAREACPTVFVVLALA